MQYCSPYIIFSLSRCVLFWLALLVCAFGFFTPDAAHARQTLITESASGKPFLHFDIFDTGEVYGSEKFGNSGATSYWNVDAGHRAALQNAADYWSALWGKAPRNSAPARIRVGTDTRFGAANINSFAGRYTELWNLLANDKQLSGDNATSNLIIGNTTTYLGPISVLPATDGNLHLAAVIVHELGHAMGIESLRTYDGSAYSFDGDMSAWGEHLVDSFGNAARPGMLIRQGNAYDSDAFVIDDANYNGEFRGYAFFQGTNTLEVIGGDGVLVPIDQRNPNEIAGVPISGYEYDSETMVFPELSHIELRNSLMSHQLFRNWGTLMEVELAILQDIGIPVDRKNFFGTSVYTDGDTDLELELGFYARNAAGTAYLPGVYNTAPLAVGLHLYGVENTVGVSGEALSAGYGGVGIRVDGWENKLTLHPGTRIHALGTGGTGLMVAYGKEHSITQRGEVLATGPGGVSARFDFGSNIMGYDYDYRGSYIHTWVDENGLRHDYLYDELNGALVTAFDVTGTLAGSAAAIFISENAHVEQINIMRGARLFGDIISHWAPDSAMIHSNFRDNDGTLLISPTTALTFGLTPDADGKATATADSEFFLDYRGNISGEQSLNVELAGGTLTYGGDMRVLSFSTRANTFLLAVPDAQGVLISAPNIDLDAGTTVGLADTISYGAPLAAKQSVLRFEGDTISANNAVQAPPKTFIHGFYDYTPTFLRWEGQNLVLGSTRVLSQERAAISALTAPMAIMVQNPYAQVFRDRAKALFAQDSSPTGLRAETQDTDPSTTSSVSEPTASEDIRRDGTSLWVTPSYGTTRRHGAHHYALSSPGVAFGADRGLDISGVASAFIGVGAYIARPTYRSDAADIDAESTTGLIYGGTRLPLDLELDAFAAIGHTRYEQQRSVHGERYGADYSSEHVGAGLSIGRTVELGANLAARPFASYEFMRLSVDGYNEGTAGFFGLDVGKSRSDLYRLNSGAALSYALDKGFVQGRVFYSGLYGDQRPEADITMTRDASGYTMCGQGWAQDEHALGLGFDFGLNVSESVRLSGGYSFIGGEKVASHQAELQLSISF